MTQAVEAVVSRSPQIDHPLIREPEHPERAAILILTSDRGFAGGYNANVLREAQRLRTLLRDQGIEPVSYVSGTKGIAWHRFRGHGDRGGVARLLRDAPGRERHGHHQHAVRGVRQANQRRRGG